MHRTLLPLAAFSILASGCAFVEPATSAHFAPGAPAPAAADKAAPADAEPAASAEETPATEVMAAEIFRRRPGDFVVYRFTGSFRAERPLTLTERVVAREDAFLVVDYTAEEGKTKDAYRVRLLDAPGARSEVLGAAHLEGGIEKPATIEAFEAWMAKTTLAADQNDGLVGTEKVQMEVGGAPLACTKTTFQVKVGKQKATLRTWESPAFPWGDVGWEITAANGRLLYRAEVVDAGHATTAAAVADSADIYE
jgi:hypothetical protein